MERVPDAWVSVSATTRFPRPGEVDGVHYYFLGQDAFDNLAETGGLLEWATYSGNSYGTPLQSVKDHMDQGFQVVLEIDVQGAFQVKEKIPEAHLVFIAPPSMQVLEQRLRGRGTETEEVVQRRMQTAQVEMECSARYDYILTNDDLETACAELVNYVNEQAETER